MIKVRVTNIGQRTRSRLGVSVKPKETVELTVTSRQFITVKAVKDFKVEIIDEENKKTESLPNENEESENNNNENNSHSSNDVESEKAENLDINKLTADEVVQAVKDGILNIDEAIALEVAGKSRVTLIEKLEKLKEELEG